MGEREERERERERADEERIADDSATKNVLSHTCGARLHCNAIPLRG